MDRFWTALLSAMGSWHQGKLFVEYSLAVEHDALHVIIGVLAWLLLAVVLRRPLSSWRLIIWLFLLAMWNEVVDMWVELWPDLGQQAGEGAKDLVLTIMIPVLLTALIRARPKMFAPSR